MTSGMLRFTGKFRVLMVVVWLLLLGNTAGMDQKDSVTVVWQRQMPGWVRCFFFVVVKP